jgi:hypothetical protein
LAKHALKLGDAGLLRVGIAVALESLLAVLLVPSAPVGDRVGVELVFMRGLGKCLARLSLA